MQRKAKRPIAVAVFMALPVVLVLATLACTDPVPPLVDDQSFGVNENAPNGTSVGTVSFLDLNFHSIGDEITVAVTGGTGGSAFAVDTSGHITVADTRQLDYETTPSFVLDIEVRDPTGLADTASVTIRLRDVSSTEYPAALEGFAVGATGEPWVEGQHPDAVPCQRDTPGRPEWTWIPPAAGERYYTASQGCDAFNSLFAAPPLNTAGVRDDTLFHSLFVGTLGGGPWTDSKVSTDDLPAAPWMQTTFEQVSTYHNRWAPENPYGIVDHLSREGWAMAEPFDNTLGILESVRVDYALGVTGLLSVGLCDEDHFSDAEVESWGATGLEILDGVASNGGRNVESIHFGTGHLVSTRCWGGQIIDALNTWQSGPPDLYAIIMCVRAATEGDPELCPFVYNPPDWTEDFNTTDLSTSSGSIAMAPEDYQANLTDDGSVFKVGMRTWDSHAFWYEVGDTADISTYHSKAIAFLQVSYLYEPYG